MKILMLHGINHHMFGKRERIHRDFTEGVDSYLLALRAAATAAHF